MNSIPNRNFQIESIQEEQNEIDSINNSSSRFQHTGFQYPNQDTDFIQGGITNYDQQVARQQVQDQIQQLYAQQKNLNYLNNNTITPVQMYMKEKLLSYQNNQNNVNSGSLIIHNEKLDNSSQITNTIEKNLEQFYINQQHPSNIGQSDGYEYTSAQIGAPQRLFQNAVQIQNSQYLYPQNQQQLQQLQQFQQMPMNGNHSQREKNQKIQQQNIHEQLIDPSQQLLYPDDQHYQNKQQITNTNFLNNNYLNNHHNLDNHNQLNNINSHVGLESNLNNPYSQNINNSLSQSNLSQGGQSQSQKNYFLVNPAFESVKKIQDKLSHKKENPQQQISPKKQKKQDGKELSPEKLINQDSKDYDGHLQENKNQSIHLVSSPKHIYLSLQTLNSAQKYKRKQESVNNQTYSKKNQTPQKKASLQNQKTKEKKFDSGAPSRASQSSIQAQSQVSNQNSESQPALTNPPPSVASKHNSIQTPKNGQKNQTRNSEIYVNDQIDEQCKFSEDQIKILNKSDEKKKVVNSIMNSKKSYLEVRQLSQNQLMKQMMIQQQKQQDQINNQLYNQIPSSQEKFDEYGLKQKALNNQKELNKLHAAQQRVTLSNKQLSNRKPAQSLSVSKSLPQFVSQESLANSAKERQNFEFVAKEDKTVEIKSKENSFAASSHFQSKIGSLQSGSIMQSKLHNQSTTSSYGQTNYFGIMTSPKTKLGESNFYQKESVLERNDFWVEHTSSHKQLLNLHYQSEEMKECSFSPIFFTNNIHKQCVVKHQNNSTRVEQSLNPTFHKQATSVKQSYQKLHNFKKQMGFIGQLPHQQVHTFSHYQ